MKKHLRRKVFRPPLKSRPSLRNFQRKKSIPTDSSGLTFRSVRSIEGRFMRRRKRDRARRLREGDETHPLTPGRRRLRPGLLGSPARSSLIGGVFVICRKARTVSRQTPQRSAESRPTPDRKGGGDTGLASSCRAPVAPMEALAKPPRFSALRPSSLRGAKQQMTGLSRGR